MLFFSWLPTHDTPFDPVAHAVEQLEVFRLRIVEAAGQSAHFEVEVPNPGIAGILSRSYRWGVVSERADGDAQAVELARGYVRGAPSELGSKKATMTFECAPPDADERKRAHADTLRTDDGLYDPLYLPEGGEDDPDVVLEARPLDWFWDRRTLALSTTHVLTGGRTVDFGRDALKGSVSIRTLAPPPKVLVLRAVAGWTQEARGKQGRRIGRGGLGIVARTYTWQDFSQSAPAIGTAVGANSGWTVYESETVVSPPGLTDRITPTPGVHPTGTTFDLQARVVTHNIRLAYDYQQAREEHLTVRLSADIQPFLDDDRQESVEVIRLRPLTVDVETPAWEGEDPETLEPRTYRVGDEVSASGKTWRCLVDHVATVEFRAFFDGVQRWERIASRAAISDRRTPRFFDTDRGERATTHLVQRGAAELVRRSRCLEAIFETEWRSARDLTCADSARLRTSAAGETLTGKVVGVELVAERGSRRARITLGIAIGRGLPAAARPEGDWVAVGDVWAALEGPPPREPVNAYGLANVLPKQEDLGNDWAPQLSAMRFVSDPEKALAAVPTVFSFRMPSLREEDLLPRSLATTCTLVPIPMGIDLGATA